MPKLTLEEISRACEDVEAFLRDNSVGSKDIIRLRLSMEEVLLLTPELLLLR